MKLIDSNHTLVKSGTLIFCLAIFVGLFGALSHIFFWFELGEIVKYDNGHDESYYLNSAFRQDWHELYLSWLPIKAMSSILHNSAWLTMLLDVFWPMLLVISSGLLALQVSKNRLLVSGFIVFYIFGVDLLSFNSTLLPQSWTLNSLLGNGPIVRQYFISPLLTFIQIFRSPEPQASLFLLTIYMAFLLAYAVRQSFKIVVLLFLVAAFVAFSYPFYALTLIMLSACFMFSLFLVGLRKKSLVIFLVTCFSLICIVIATSFREDTLGATVYSSHHPAFSLTIAYGILVASVTFLSTYKQGGLKYWAKLSQNEQLFKIFGVLCLLLPIVTLNQQVVSGKMVLLTHWEKLVNYNVLVIGLLLVLTSSRRVKQWRSAGLMANKKAVYAVSCLVLLVLLVSMTTRQYQYWSYANIQAVAYSKAINNAFLTDNIIETQTPIFLDKPTRDQLVKARFDYFELTTMGYSKVLQNTFKLNADNTLFDLSESLPQLGFESAARMGFTKAQLLTSLQLSIDRQSCWPYIAYFFSVRDCSPLQSTYRNYQPDKLRGHLGEISESYAKYLQLLVDGSHQHSQKSAIVVKLFSESPPQVTTNSYWSESVIRIESLEQRDGTLLGLSKRFWPSKTVVLLQRPIIVARP